MISALHIAAFRNLNGFEFIPAPGITVVSGKNGIGKTTILEAAYLLCQGFSFRSRALDELIPWNAPEMLLRGEFDSGASASTRAVLLNRSGRIVVKKDGEECERLSSFFGTAPAVVMEPSDIELVRGAPEMRRRYLDEILCFRKAQNADTLRRFRRVLRERNQWLRQNRLRAGSAVGGEDLLQVLTHQLVDLSAEIWVERTALVAEISGILSGYYAALSAGADGISCAYRSSVFSASEGQSKETFRAKFLEKLDSLESSERDQGLTLAGPHKDDFVLISNEHDLRSVGSQGQCRSAAIAMRFTAVDIAGAHLMQPLLLLDDVFAELDPVRRSSVAEIIRGKKCQVFVATPRAEDLPFAPDLNIRL